jgi:predicted helicase
VANNLRTIALTRVFGFEIMPAPFVISHLQIASLLENLGAPLGEGQRAGVFLTNALTGWVPEEHPQSVIFEEFRREREHSEDIKQQGPILVILGNPPYNGYAGIGRIEEERDLTSAYRTPIQGLPSPQGQGLNDLYIRFFRIAERRIAANSDGKGIVCFISNYSWLDGLSYTTMRHNFLHTFADIYIDNLHGDRKISEYAPDGRTSETIFAVTGTSVGIRIGTAINTMVRNTNSANRPGTVHYRDFEDARASTRRESLIGSIVTDEPSYSSTVPNLTLGLPFKPRVFEAEYLLWPRLSELFPFSSPGVKTSRDSLVIDIDRGRLESRMKQYLGTDANDAEIRELVFGAMEGSARFDPIRIRRVLQERGFRPWQILRYTYRPFDVRWLYWEPETKLLDEKRSEYVKQMIGATLWIEARQNESGEVFSRGTATRSLSDNFGNGLSNFFPAIVLDSAGTLMSAIESHANLSAAAEAHLVSISAPPLSLFLHALATMHTPRYRAENAGALLVDWPRIPIPTHADLLASSAILGQRLADLLDAESSANFGAEWSFFAALKLPQNPDLKRSLKITAGWGRRGQASTVMPGQGLAPARDWTAAEREKLAKLAAEQSLAFENALSLLGETCLDVHLNGESFWSSVPINVWNYTLGGYQVLKKWLSYREFSLLGRSLGPEETTYFAQVVRRIAAILLLGPALDANYQAILPTATGLPTP